MLKTPRYFTAAAVGALTLGAVTLGVSAPAIAAPETLTITPTTSTAVLNGTGGVDLTYSMEVTVPEGTTEALTMKVTGGWPGGGVDPVRQSASNLGGSCAPASLPAPGAYTVTCTTTGEAPMADVVDFVGSVEASKMSQWGYPLTVGGAEVVARYTAATPPVVEPPVVEPPVVEPPVVEPPVVEPPVIEPPVVVEPPLVGDTPVVNVECAHEAVTARKQPGHGWETTRTVSKTKAYTTGSARYCGEGLDPVGAFDAGLVQAAAAKRANKAIRAHLDGRRVLRAGTHRWRTKATVVTCTFTTASAVTNCGKPHLLAASTTTIRINKAGDITKQRTVTVDPDGVRMDSATVS